MKRSRECIDWATANQRHLMASVALVQAQLAAYFHLPGDPVETARRNLETAQGEMPSPSRIQTLRALFALSEFEQSVVLLCAGSELDGSFAEFVSALPHKAGTPARATFSLALAALPDAHWSAIAPESPLRFWNLVVPTSAETLVRSPLRVDERVLHFLAGLDSIDRRLEDTVEQVPPTGGVRALPPSHRALVERLAAQWTAAGPAGTALQLCGPDGATNRVLAAEVCSHLRLKLHAVDVRDLPTAAAERHTWMRLWERESVLNGSALLIECHDGAPPEFLRTAQKVRGPVLFSTREPLLLTPRSSLRVDVPRPSYEEQQQIWRDALQGMHRVWHDEVEDVIGHFDLPAAAIALTARLAQANPLPKPAPAGGAEQKKKGPLWHLCRAQVSTRVGELAQRVETRAQWDELILPNAQKAILRTILAQVRQRAKVLETWGFAKGCSRGLGLSVLFAGPSGTGKTMSAEVLAGRLELDLYRIDLSAVVSKYIGETEKNLRRIFDAAESGGAVLLFDEADALFGRRSEVKDSHDRYANIEVSYLLQRMENYRGLAILTTNQKQTLDSAFVRRLRFIVTFPFPDVAQREEIWASVFPKATAREGLDFGKLAQLNVTGGSISNIALNAAFLAAEAGQPVQMQHLLDAAQAEAVKLERPLMETEVAGWS